MTEINLLTPENALPFAYLRQAISFAEIDKFKTNLTQLFNRINENETEEHLKNIVADFLKDTYYKPDFEINTKGRQDLVIHKGSLSRDEVGVILEVKKPSNAAEMFSPKKPQAKALCELLLYYLRETIESKNLNISKLVICNIWEWYIFDGYWFEKVVYRNSQLQKDYQNWKISGKDTQHFYQHIAEPFLKSLEKIEVCYFDLRTIYAAPLTQKSGQQIKADSGELIGNFALTDEELVPYYKIFSPEFLLQKPYANDANSLNTAFYFELLHILGLKEKEENGIVKIVRKALKERNEGSLLENVISKITPKIPKNNATAEVLPSTQQDLATEQNWLFETGLELTITWLNRILFLKLLESQLISYHKPTPNQSNTSASGRNYAFLNIDFLADFDEVEELFFDVLAIPDKERTAVVSQKFGHLPYLNSALFERTDLEKQLITIGCLRDRLVMPIYEQTVLKDEKGKPCTGTKKTLTYLFEFLNAYNFGSESEDILQETPKTIINAAVLGLIFEKLNGYADGAFFTPSFVTSYMCREIVQKSIVQKFNKAAKKDAFFPKNITFQNFEELKEKMPYYDTETRKWANEVFKSIRICDPAVGSGHFLTEVLNELLFAKSELKILSLADGERLKEFYLEVDNGELLVVDIEDRKKILAYRKPFLHTQSTRDLSAQKNYRHTAQETIFHEKQTLIENCLFGVDINPKSVLICRLRLWIELLKNAYYTHESGYRELQTLPNIDINIKIGNSLVSRFGMNGKHKRAAISGNGGLLPKDRQAVKLLIEKYKILVKAYKESRDNSTKQDLRRQIGLIKSEFEKFAAPNDKGFAEMRKKEGELLLLSSNLFNREDLEKLRETEKEIAALRQQYIEKLQTVYKNSFEWRFEFPEILDEDGEFVGFDAVVGNPPYIRQEMLGSQKAYFATYYPETFAGTADIYVYFFERVFELIQYDGYYSFIVPNKWLRTGYGKGLRKLLRSKKIHKFLDFGDTQIFGSATTYTCIVIGENSTDTQDFEAYKLPKAVYDFKEASLHELTKNKFFPVQLQNLDEDNWLINNPLQTLLLQKLEQAHPKLQDLVTAYRGVVTGYNDAFVIDETTKNRLIAEDANSAAVLKPVLRGRDMQPWRANYQNLWLIYIPWHFPLNLDTTIKGASEKAEKEFSAQYPAIYKHLLGYKQELSTRNQTETGKRYEWYALQRFCSNYWQEFEKPKIMYQVLQVKPCFIYDESGFYCNNSVWFIPDGDKYLLGILNSKIGWFLISQYCTAIQNGFQLIFDYFGKLPIAQATQSQKAEVEKLVDAIRAVQALQVAENAGNDLVALENALNQQIYQIYGLSAEEIQLVESVAFST